MRQPVPGSSASVTDPELCFSPPANSFLVAVGHPGSCHQVGMGAVRRKTWSSLGVRQRTEPDGLTGVTCPSFPTALRAQQRAGDVLNQLEFFPGVMELNEDLKKVLGTAVTVARPISRGASRCFTSVVGEGLALAPAAGGEGCVSFFSGPYD